MVVADGLEPSQGANLAQRAYKTPLHTRGRYQIARYSRAHALSIPPCRVRRDLERLRAVMLGDIVVLAISGRLGCNAEEHGSDDNSKHLNLHELACEPYLSHDSRRVNTSLAPRSDFFQSNHGRPFDRHVIACRCYRRQIAPSR